MQPNIHFSGSKKHAAHQSTGQVVPGDLDRYAFKIFLNGD